MIDLLSLGACAIVLLCLMSEAFFAAAELSIISSNALELERLSNDGDLKAQRVLWFKSRPEQLFATTLLGTNVSTVTGSTVASLAMLQIDPERGEWWALLIMSPLVLVGAEIIPKTIGQARADQLSRRLAGPLYVLHKLGTPIMSIVELYTKLLYKTLRIDSGQQSIAVSRKELLRLANHEGPSGDLEEEEREMIGRILEFGELKADDSLVPLAEIVAIEANQNVKDAVALIAKHGYSRLPVYDSRVDNIIGLLHHLDLLSCDDGNRPVRLLMRPTHFVPESQEVDEILYLLQRETTAAAVVVDEFGGAVGLLTLEDVLEEIVGEIKDEHDQDTHVWRQVDRGVLISGRAPVEKLSADLNVEVPESPEYETVAGYLLEHFKRIPQVGERVTTHSGDTFVVERASPRAIEEVLLIRADSSD